MKCSMTGDEKGDLLIEVTAWAGLPVCVFLFMYEDSMINCTLAHSLNSTHQTCYQQHLDFIKETCQNDFLDLRTFF